MIEVTRKNIHKFYVTRKDNKCYFKFPWFKERDILICEASGLIFYWKKKSYQDKEVKGLIFDSAYKAYKLRVKKGPWDKKHAKTGSF